MMTHARIYKTMQGKEIDINRIIVQNETTMAVGNVKANARGDELGPGGKIITRREDSLRDTPIHKQRINQDGFSSIPRAVVQESPTAPVSVGTPTKKQTTKDTPPAAEEK